MESLVGSKSHSEGDSEEVLGSEAELDDLRDQLESVDIDQVVGDDEDVESDEEVVDCDEENLGNSVDRLDQTHEDEILSQVAESEDLDDQDLDKWLQLVNQKKQRVCDDSRSGVSSKKRGRSEMMFLEEP